MAVYRFAEDFYFGAATAAYQAEGATNIDGKGQVAWDKLYHQSGSTFNADEASDFYHRYQEDLALAKAHGVNAIRISLAWSRIIPQGVGAVNAAGLAFYHNLIDACLEHGVEPFVTLHHFDTPLALFEQGDWLNREQIAAFSAYAKVCFEAFGQKVKHWITINEPWSVVAGQYIMGHFPPHTQYNIGQALQAMHHMLLAHTQAALLYKQMALPGKIGIVHILESKYPLDVNSLADQQAAAKEDVLANVFMLDGYFLGGYRAKTLEQIEAILAHYPNQTFVVQHEDNLLIKQAPEVTDFLGVNYYASHFLAHYEGESQIHHNGNGQKGSAIYANKGIGKRVLHPQVPTTDWDWPIYPQGLYDMLIRLQQEYPNVSEIYITENGMGAKEQLGSLAIIDDSYRIEYISQHLAAVALACQQLVNVRGYFLWSLMDLFSWTNGFNKRYGLFYVDFVTQKRAAKASALWWRELSKNKRLNWENNND